MKYEAQEGQTTAAFTGTSKESMEDALQNAAKKAKDYFKSIGREETIYLQILRHEIAVENPYISEYRVFITEGGGG